MGLFHSPRIVTDGLVMALDAANTKSYPGTGTTWFDISGNSNNATLNSVTHKSDNGGVFETAGALTSYIDNNTINLTSTNFTVFCASRYSNIASAGRVVNALSNNFLIGHHGGRALGFSRVRFDSGSAANKKRREDRANKDEQGAHGASHGKRARSIPRLTPRQVRKIDSRKAMFAA